ncbi:PREDICTED: uncharacterized protein C11orf85 homolog [Elephantulus edwardii]|uniref:uncharacterized protein C11orf85 homolog n=1 Tax=Elephantulus edwardii TaxID=28737 RepID=UPI0003F05BD5|nr:PREDICTED: uncharacterized protein C11orf85 homolog [Elephantulus edwardii]
MSLKPFTYPFPETRFFHTGCSVYKFKIRYGNSIRGEEIENKDVIIRELEDSVRVVLGNLDNLQPFATEHFIIFPYKSKWERVSHLKFKHGNIPLVPYPFVFTLYVEMKCFHEHLSSGKQTEGEEAEESGFSLKVPDEKKTAGAMKRKRRFTDMPSTPRKSELDRDNVGTFSQDPTEKQPPVKAKKRERRTQQEWQEAPAFAIPDVQEQDPGSKLEDSLGGQMASSRPQSTPAAPQEPVELGTTMGFFGFLSSLFPFRYLFRKNQNRR